MLDGHIRPTEPQPDPEPSTPAESAAPATPDTALPGSPPAAPAPAGEVPGIVAAVSHDVGTAWSKLDAGGRQLARTAAAAIAITVVGVPVGAWGSAQFAFLILTAGVVLIVAAFLGAMPASRGWAVPLSSVELWATGVVAVLTLLKAVEVVFDLGALAGAVTGILSIVATAALGAAAAGLVVVTIRRGNDPLADLRRADQGARLAVAGLGLVVMGWAYNLSISFWTIAQAVLPLSVLTLAALVVLDAPRIRATLPVAWVGAAVGVAGGVLVLGNWNALFAIGRTQLTLDPPDWIGFVVITLGAILIVTGGGLSGRDSATARIG